MPDAIGHWITGYLYAKGIVDPTAEQVEEAIEALERYRLDVGPIGDMN